MIGLYSNIFATVKKAHQFIIFPEVGLELQEFGSTPFGLVGPDRVLVTKGGRVLTPL